MRNGGFRSDRVRTAVLAACLALAGHFAVSSAVWVRFFLIFLRDPTPPWRAFLVGGAPAVVLLLWFSVAAVLAWRRRRVSLVMWVLGVLGASALFAHDAATHNWQMHAEYFAGEGSAKTFFYFTWWWYDSRWLEGIV